jgi:hypothetical protein
MPTYPPNVTFTPRLAMPRPGLDDPADGPDAFNDLTDYLDPIATVYAQGTLAARPAAGVVGRLYWATDTRTLFYDDASAWRPVSGATAAATALPVGDVGMAGQIRAGRQLTVADFTSLGLAQPVGLWNLSDLSNLGSDPRALSNKGAVPFGVGINGLAATSAVFAGSASQALYIPDSGAADPLRIRTGSFGCWFRTAKRGVVQMMLSKSGDAAGSYSYVLFAATGVAAWVSVDGSNTVTASSISDLTDDRWHFGVVTFDATALRLYVDGVLEATNAVSGAIFAGAAPLNIGGRKADATTSVPAGEAFYGRADEAFVSADVLSEDQVRCLYAATLPHTLGVTPTGVRLNVTRRRKGAPLAVADFTTQPLRLHNFTAGALTDQGSNAQTLTNNGAALSVAGADGTPGGAYSFAGAQTLSATDAGLPGGLATRSYGAWVKTTTNVGGNAFMGYGGTIATADMRFMVSAGVLVVTSGADVINGPFCADGQWHLGIAVDDNAAGDGVRRKLYLDGRLVGGSTVMNAITLTGANRFRVGSYADGTQPFTGQIDGAFVCGYALAQDEILRLYAKGSQDLGSSPKEPGTHIERLDASRLLLVADTLDSQHTIDLGITV